MADNNITTYRNQYSNNRIQSGGCMMHVGNQNTPTEIFIKFDEVNDNLTKEEVERWVNIGNELIFPAKLDEHKIDTENYNVDKRFDKYLGLMIEFDWAKGFYESDATHVAIGKFLGTPSKYEDVKNRRGRSKTAILKDLYGVINPPEKQSWNGALKNHRLIDTKENLEDYILRTIDTDDPKPIEQESKVNSYRITIDYGSEEFISYAHKLATLSFYRYLWGNYFHGLVKKVLHLIDLGVGSWDALYAVLSEKDNVYGNYYSLLSSPGIKSIEEVKHKLINSQSVNNCFTSKDRKEFLWIDNDDRTLLARVNKFIATKKTFIQPKNTAYQCISPTKTLTRDKVYKAKVNWCREGIVLITGDDYITREYQKSRFLEVEI